jgi:hypothetical protein
MSSIAGDEGGMAGVSDTWFVAPLSYEGGLPRSNRGLRGKPNDRRQPPTNNDT